MFGRLPLILFGIAFAVASFWTWLAVHDHNLRIEIIAEFNTQQEQLLAQKKEEFDNQMKELQSKSDDLKKEIDDKNASLETITTDIDKNMKSTDASDAAAPYLKEIVTKLQKSFGDKDIKK
jgi:peptidoglycan hydrolase CwlO-like protein